MKQHILLVFLCAGPFFLVQAQIDTQRVFRGKNIEKQRIPSEYEERLKKKVDISGNKPAPAAEPEYIYGYVSWTDPSTGKKHIPKGMDARTMKWDYVTGYPTYDLIFTNRATGENKLIYFEASGPFQRLVDSAGRECFLIIDSLDNIRYALRDSARYTRAGTYYYFSEPMGYRYKFLFRLDRSFTGLPYDAPASGSEKAAIRYNPDLWSFTSIRVSGWLIPARLVVPAGEFPVRPVVWALKSRPFSDLPDF